MAINLVIESCWHVGVDLGQSHDPTALLKEFQDFRVSFTSDGHAIFNARQGKHDDLVLAVSLAVFGASRPRPLGPDALSHIKFAM